MRDKSTIGGPRREASRDLVRLACPSCDDEVRVPADEVRPKCERCDVLLLDGAVPLNPRPHDLAVEYLAVFRAHDGEPVRYLEPVPGGYAERPFPEFVLARRPRGAELC